MPFAVVFPLWYRYCIFTVFLICISVTNLIYLRSFIRYILQMYQGVITQCSGVAHNLRFSEFSQSAESFLFTFQYLPLWGIISIPILMHMGHLPSYIFCQLFAALYEAFTIPYIFNGALALPILGCFHCTLHLPLLWGA